MLQRAFGGLRIIALAREAPTLGQEHLPPDREGIRFYAPDDAEAAFRERLAALRRVRGREP